ncbi:PREDICTED: 28S ribosomal protein S24, mitochondrial-like [Priapulus caudatus]|uniref:28S ribosomal protein S24, mitochondrial-like n=1 Tax=Priapulus caudatus TaxID=37621 RepID=A0ABM1EZB9_PRICU|nr:PREDICTED: 28S ribosomal protein S24, mitochondrial-like [Priapulus caudatus]
MAAPMWLLVSRSAASAIGNTHRRIATTAACCKVQAGRYKITLKQNKPLTYEQAHPPFQIGVCKSWNSWNTSNLCDAPRASDTLYEDMFIRKFMAGTWHGIFVSEVIIKRRHNAVYVSGVVQRRLHARKLYFLVGYTEEILARFLKCIVKVEVQSVGDRRDVVFKYI